MRIDCHSHVFPEAYAEVLKRNPKSPQATGRDGVYTICYGDMQKFRLNLDDYSVERKLRDMDAAGIDITVLSVNMPGPERLVPELALEGARACNDSLAEIVGQHPDRFVAIASLPLQDVPAAIAELDRAIDELDLRGAMIFSHVDGKPVDAPEFEPFYRHAAMREIPLVFHPTVPTWGEIIKDYSMIPMVGLMVDTSFAMLRLILGGVLERHPGLKIVQPHAGGVLPYLMGRIEEQTEVKRRGRDHIMKPPSAYYENVYLDVASPSSLAIQYVYDFAGPAQMLFGSDHPWVSIDTLLNLVEGLEISEADKSMILGTNARDLFKIN